MSKCISGKVVCTVEFSGLLVEGTGDMQVLDAVFPDGWEGEMSSQKVQIDSIDEEDEEG